MNQAGATGNDRARRRAHLVLIALSSVTLSALGCVTVDDHTPLGRRSSPPSERVEAAAPVASAQEYELVEALAAEDEV